MVCVHQGTELEAQGFFATWGGAGFGRIADPTRRLYEAFDLKRASLRQAFGFPMWRRGIDASRRGFVLGRVAGDAWQMPGCFVLHRGRVLSSFPYDMVSDRPDYLAFLDDALDAGTQLTLLPDGSLLEPPSASVLAAWQTAARASEALLPHPQPLRLSRLAIALDERQRQTGRISKADAAVLARAGQAGIRIPQGWFLPQGLEPDALVRFLGNLPPAQWFSASVSCEPRQASWDANEAPKTGTPATLAPLLLQLLEESAGGVLLLHAPDPSEPGLIQGVARVRALATELELWETHGEKPSTSPLEVTLSPLGTPWTSLPPLLPGALTLQHLTDGLLPLLERARKALGTPVLEASWQFQLEDGFRLTRVRPVEASVRLRRLLSTAVVRELSPPIPSPLFVDGLEAAGVRIQGWLERLDPGLRALSEPLVIRENGRLFLNADVLGQLIARWGISSAFLARWLGGGFPHRSASPGRWLWMLPSALRLLAWLPGLLGGSRSVLLELHTRLLKAESRRALLEWYGAAMSALGEVWLGLALSEVLIMPWESSPPLPSGRRGLFEADPAWPRAEPPESSTEPGGFLPDPLAGVRGWRWLLLGRAGIRANRGWVRDSALRLLAEFRERLLASLTPAVEAGALDDAESCWALGLAELLRPESEWEMLLRLPRRAPAQEPPPLFFLGDDLGLEAFDAPLCIVRAGEAEGRAVVASLPTQALKQLRTVKAPAVLVVPALGPGWEAVLPKVVGVVAGLGGRLSVLSGLDALPPGAPVILNAAGWVHGVQAGAWVKITRDGRLEGGHTSGKG